MNWYWLQEKDLLKATVKAHCVPSSLLDIVREDLESRFKLKLVSEPAVKFCIELGGIMMVDRQIMGLTLDGLDICFPAHQLHEILKLMEQIESPLPGSKTKPRHRGYLKLPHYMHSTLVLPLPHWDRLKERFHEALPGAREIEFAENREFNRRLASGPGSRYLAIKPRPEGHGPRITGVLNVVVVDVLRAHAKPTSERNRGRTKDSLAARRSSASKGGI